MPAGRAAAAPVHVGLFCRALLRLTPLHRDLHLLRPTSTPPALFPFVGDSEGARPLFGSGQDSRAI